VPDLRVRVIRSVVAAHDEWCDHPGSRTVAVEIRMVDKLSRVRTLAREIVAQTLPADREMFLCWLQELKALRDRDLSFREKAIAVARLTHDRRGVWPLVKITASTLRKHGWTDRSWKARLSVGAAVATLASVGSAGAGIAALGGAIGVPLWLVFGAGGILAGTLIDELLEALPPREPRHPTVVVTPAFLQKQLSEPPAGDAEMVPSGVAGAERSQSDRQQTGGEKPRSLAGSSAGGS
jgi:hypothetical protein